MRRIKKQPKAYLPAFLAIIILLPALPTIFSVTKNKVKPFLSDVLERVALTSLMVNAPEGSTKLLKERFAYKEAPSSPNPNQSTSQEKAPIDNIVILPDREYDIKPSIPTIENTTPPDIDPKYRGTIIGESFSGTNNSAAQQFGDIYIRNYTQFSPEEISEILKTPAKLNLTPNSDAPQVLIYHTHATESFEGYDSPYYDTRGTWRTTDNNNNMVAVGGVLAEELENAGINVIQNRTHHDYPSYNGSYERSGKTITEYLKEYPSIKVVIDLHRDAMEREGNVIVKPIVEINGEKVAQIMAMTCYDPSIKNWKNNLRFAAEVTDVMEINNPGIMRPIYFCDGKYNQGIAPTSILVEVGSHANTLSEAKRSAKALGIALAEIFKNDMAAK